MIHQCLRPGVEDGGKPDLRAQVNGVLGQLDEGLRCGLEQEVVDDSLVSQSEGVEVFGQGEDQVEIGHWQQVCFLSLQPSFFVQALALGAMPVSAGVVGDPDVTAGITGFHVASQGSGTAGLDGAHRPEVTDGHLMAVGLPIGLPKSPEDIGDFPC